MKRDTTEGFHAGDAGRAPDGRYNVGDAGRPPDTTAALGTLGVHGTGRRVSR